MISKKYILLAQLCLFVANVGGQPSSVSPQSNITNSNLSGESALRVAYDVITGRAALPLGQNEKIAQGEAGQIGAILQGYHEALATGSPWQAERFLDVRSNQMAEEKSESLKITDDRKRELMNLAKSVVESFSQKIQIDPNFTKLLGPEAKNAQVEAFLKPADESMKPSLDCFVVRWILSKGSGRGGFTVNINNGPTFLPGSYYLVVFVSPAGMNATRAFHVPVMSGLMVGYDLYMGNPDPALETLVQKTFDQMFMQFLVGAGLSSDDIANYYPQLINSNVPQVASSPASVANK